MQWGLKAGASPAYKPVGPGLQIFGLITLPLVVGYALLGWAKKLKSPKCWWGQCILVMRAVFRICGNESQPGLKLVKKLATSLKSAGIFNMMLVNLASFKFPTPNWISRKISANDSLFLQNWWGKWGVREEKNQKPITKVAIRRILYNG